MDETLHVALEAGRIFTQLKVRWLLGGSLASSAHGIPRATFDADLLADLHATHIQPFLKALGDCWYADEQAIRDAITGRSSFNLIHFDTALKVDVFIPKLRHFERMEFARARPVILSEETGETAPVCCPEDIIVAKLEWFRSGGELSERQWADVLGVLRLNRDHLDTEVMRTSATELGVLDLLEKALDDGDPPIMPPHR